MLAFEGFRPATEADLPAVHDVIAAAGRWLYMEETMKAAVGLTP